MRISVTVLSACDLRRSETEVDVCPRVRIAADGCLVMYVGSVGGSLSKKAKTPNPIWSDTFEIQACLASSFKFIVYHYRPIITDVEIGSCSISLREVEFGHPITIPLNMKFPCDPVPTLTVEFQLCCSPYDLIPEKKRAKKVDDILMFMAYDPPVPQYAPAPVEFSLSTVNFEDKLFCAYDQTHHWGRIGFSGNNQLFNGPTGPTYQGIIRSDYVRELDWKVVISSKGYTGRVTYNLLAIDSKRLLGRDIDGIPKKEGSIWGQFSVDVEKDTTTTLPLSFHLVKGSLSALSDASAALDDHDFRRRFMLPRTRPFNFSDFSDVWGCAIPTKLNVVLSWRRTSMPEGEGDDIRMVPRFTVFDAENNIIGEMKQGPLLLSWTDALCDNMIRSGKNTEFQEESTIKIKMRAGFTSYGSYTDWGNIFIDLAGLPLNVTAIVISGRTTTSNMTGDGCLRFIDLTTSQELGVYGFHKQNGSMYFQVFGALVRKEDSWAWQPVNYASELIKGKKEKIREIWLANVTKME